MQNPNDKDDEDLLIISLSCNRPAKRARVEDTPPPSNPILLRPYTANNTDAPAPTAAVPRPRPHQRRRRSGAAKSETIPPPYPWARNRRGTVQSLKYLRENKITAVTGSVECKRCKSEFKMVLDVESKLAELWSFIQRERENMYDRAPMAWLNPVLPKCEQCGEEDSIKPLFAGIKKRAINWLFLLLGQMIGCCKLKHLKYYLKHTNIHRTGAKDRIVFSTYIDLCKQLVPDWFD